ncbi:molybdenum cofactor biosynthesis protein MoaE [Sanguibacter keddieii]|uniref:molybdenum cofactor biosynthesis protein MoaE n=1 Tax=Sanguibacter keddieii TaxID=60920 RepID=UPI00065FCC82|nr:molybdenum cofactor biosynthesis protein MoaE [Sanguibacter keddieii]
MSAEIATGITDEPLDTGALIDSARRDTCGAVASFVGVVRNHDGGESVDAIEYSSHPSSQQILRDIAVEFKDRPGVHRIVAWHRVGRLGIGEDAMVVAVAAEHRAQAFRAVEAIVEDVKAKLPIWKKQELTDGSHNWSGL